MTSSFDPPGGTLNQSLSGFTDLFLGKVDNQGSYWQLLRSESPRTAVAPPRPPQFDGEIIAVPARPPAN